MRRHETGTTRNGLHYLRLHGGRRILVYLPGLDDCWRDLTWSPRLRSWQFGACRMSHTIYGLSRPALAPHHSLRTLADDTANGIQEIVDRERPENGQVDLTGASYGGVFSLLIAAHYPALVRRLIVQMAAHRLAPTGFGLGLRWLALAEQGRPQALLRSFFGDSVGGGRGALARLVLLLLAPWLGGRPSFLPDAARYLHLISEIDLTELLPRVTAPTLFIGSRDDPFFSGALLTEAAALVGAGTVRLFPGRNHAAFVHHRRAYDGAIVEFLRTSESDRRGSVRP
ncbi:MAG: alpha/beta hydrolase [Alphaproteobacteria bacterium]|nr:alpha/beta hydrolase [Alphaproteobacteria bacterium]